MLIFSQETFLILYPFLENSTTGIALLLGNVMPDFDFPEPLINYDEDEETEAQKDPEIESQVEPVGAQIEPVGAQIESVGAQSEPVEAQKQTSTDEAQKVEEEPQQIQQSKIFVCNIFNIHCLTRISKDTRYPFINIYGMLKLLQLAIAM